MNRQDKVEVIELLKNGLSASDASFIVSFKGLSVAQMQTLRKQLRTQGAKLKVAKGRLMKLASKGLPAQDLAPFFKEQIGLVFATKDSSAIAKVLHEFSKKNNALKIVAGCMESKIVDQTHITKIASLPSREVLLAQLCGTLQLPMYMFVAVLKEIHKQRSEPSQSEPSEATAAPAAEQPVA